MKAMEIIRRCEEQDIPAVLALYRQGSAYLEDAGVPQWLNGYPGLDNLRADMAAGGSYVLEQDGRIAGTCFLSLEPDPNYAVIENGAWLNGRPYVTIHRIAVRPDAKGRGAAALFVKEAEQLARRHNMADLRADTHEKNRSMRRFLAKNGFVCTGLVHLADGAPRLAFQKRIDDSVHR